MTPAVAPADQRRRPRQLSLAGDLARRDVSERLGREAEPARRDVRPRPARPRAPKTKLLKEAGPKQCVDGARADDAEQRRFAGARIGCSDGEGPTLESVLSGVWEGLLTAGVADCPVCGAEMKRAEGESASCSGCGSTLS